MNIKNVTELFNYISCLPCVEVKVANNVCAIWKSNEIIFTGTYVEEINSESRNLIEDHKSFIYNQNKLATIRSYDEMFEFSPEPQAFLFELLDQNPDILPIELKLNNCRSDIEHAEIELFEIRQKLGELKSELNTLVDKCYELERAKEYLQNINTKISSESNRKTKQIVKLLFPPTQNSTIISVHQIKAMCSFLKRNVQNHEIRIDTGYTGGVVRLTYEVQQFGTADLAGIPVGFEKETVFFDTSGKVVNDVSANADSGITLGWDELVEIEKII